MNYALIVAAGKGTRMGRSTPKPFIQLAGIPILTHSLKTFDKSKRIDQIVLVVAEDQIDYCQSHVVAPGKIQKPVIFVAGGERRQDSVFKGLNRIADHQGIVLIHDGARPLVTLELIEACVNGAQKWSACIPGVEPADTLKEIDKAGFVFRTAPRQLLRQVQTPQAFDLELVRKAHDEARKNNWSVTDDAAMVEHMGHKVRIIAGEITNLKITTSTDLVLAEALYSVMN
jgi:2-C-methyl-D-erythritol 4-phosphate cytidylyltransferase